MKLNPTEKHHFLALVKVCGDRLGRNGCNDFPVDNTDENWKLCEEIGAENVHMTIDQWRKNTDYQKRPKKNEKIFLHDSIVFRYLALKAVR